MAEKPQYASLRAGGLGGLHQIEAMLDLAQQQREILALARGQAGQDLLFPAQQARDQFLVERAAFPRHAQPEFAAVIRILDAFHQLPLHQRVDGAADGGFVGSGAMGDVLRAAGILAEAERRQHPPFRDVEPVTRLIFDRKCRADLGCEPVEAEGHEPEEVE